MAARAGASAVNAAATADNLEITSKLAGHDLVTAADRAAEQAILDVLRRARPQDAVLAEESGRRAGTSGVRWLIDPLDGTANFVYGRSDYAVSVAAERHGELVAGAVVRPADGHWMKAGDGVVLGGPESSPAGVTRPGTLSRPTSPREALITFGLPYSSLTRRQQALSLVATLTPRVRAVRVIGSAACDLLSLLSGQCDAACTIELAEWDTAAGHAGVLAAGGVYRRVTTASGLSVLVAGHRTVVEALAELVAAPA